MQIQHDFGINTPEGLALSVDMWKLPPGSSTALLRDDDNLKVAQSTEPSLQVGLARLVPAHAHAGTSEADSLGWSPPGPRPSINRMCAEIP